MSPFGETRKSYFSPDTHCRGKFTNERPKWAKCLRRRVILKLRKLSAQLLKARLRLARELPPKAHSRSLNIPLIMLIVDAVGYPGKQQSRDLVYGIGIVGGGATNSLDTRAIPDTTNLERVKNSLSARNRSILKALEMAKNLTLKRKRWGLSADEF